MVFEDRMGRVLRAPWTCDIPHYLRRTGVLAGTCSITCDMPLQIESNVVQERGPYDENQASTSCWNPGLGRFNA